MNLLRYLLGLFRAFPRQVLTLFASAQVNMMAFIFIGGWVSRGYLNHLAGVKEDAMGLGPALALLALSALLGIGSLVAYMGSMIAVMRHSMALLCLNIMERVLGRPGGLPLPEDRGRGRPISEGQCLNTLSNDTVMVPGMFNYIFDMAAIAVSGVAAFVIMFSIDRFVTAVVFLPLAFLFLLLGALGKRIEPLAEKARRSAGEVSSLVSDMFNCVQTVKTAAAEDRLVREFRRRNERRLADSLRSELLFTLLRGLNSGLMELGAGIVLLAAAASIRGGDFTVGDFVLFTSYLWAVLGIFRWGGNFFAEVKRNNVSIDRMEALMRPSPPLAPVRPRHLSLARVPVLELSVDPGSIPPLGRLEVRGLSYRYPYLHDPRKDEESEGDSGEGRAAESAEAAPPPEEGPVPAGPLPFGIEDIDFDLEGGSLTVVTGPVGSGKTTLLRSVLGLLPAEARLIAWDGRETPRGSLTERSAFWEAPRAAYTPQVPRLFSNSLRENILLGVPEGEVDLGELASRACLEPDLREMAAGLDTEIGPRGVRLSGGQVQRTAAARMFARRARLLVLDDISSALDVETERRLWERLAARKDGATYLVVSHREALFRRADQILVMEGGRIVARGAFEELSSGCELFRSLLRNPD